MIVKNNRHVKALFKFPVNLFNTRNFLQFIKTKGIILLFFPIFYEIGLKFRTRHVCTVFEYIFMAFMYMDA